MNKKERSERDICTKFITPAITAAGKWDLASQIREEFRLPNGVFAPYTGIKTNKTKPIRIKEFDAEKKWWGKPGQEHKRKETEFAWRVSIADIAARDYNLDVKNPNIVDPTHRDPAELLAEYQAAQAAVAEVRDKLELKSALML